MAHLLGGEVDRSAHQEFGKALLVVDDSSDLLAEVGDVVKVWMSHADKVTKLPPGFAPIAHTDNSPVAAFSSKSKKIYGVQFHPEVVHTAKGKEILSNFLFKVCGCTGDWKAGNFIEEKIREIKQTCRKPKSHLRFERRCRFCGCGSFNPAGYRRQAARSSHRQRPDAQG